MATPHPSALEPEHDDAPESLQEFPPRPEAQLVYRRVQAARLLGIPVSRLDYLIATGELPARKLGASVVIRHDELVRFVDALPAREASA